MKVQIVIGLIALLALMAFLAGQFVSSAKAAPHQENPMEDPAQMKEMMEKMFAAMKPGDHHKHLEQFVGEWNTTLKIFMGGPGALATETKGTASVRWALNGRFIMEEAKWTMMMPDLKNPMSMERVTCEGLGLMGYDNYKNMYVGMWADNMSTHLLTMRGSRHPETNLFTYYGEMDEPGLEVGGRTVKYENRIVNEDKHVFSIYDLHVSEDYKVLEITYTRKK
jgi:hypothetical protein